MYEACLSGRCRTGSRVCWLGARCDDRAGNAVTGGMSVGERMRMRDRRRKHDVGAGGAGNQSGSGCRGVGTGFGAAAAVRVFYFLICWRRRGRCGRGCSLAPSPGVVFGLRRNPGTCLASSIGYVRKGAATVVSAPCRNRRRTVRVSGFPEKSEASAQAEANGSQTWASSACPIPGFTFLSWAA